MSASSNRDQIQTLKLYIKFNDAEWKTLMENIQTINKTIKDFDSLHCDACNDLKTRIVLEKDSKKMTRSKMTKQKIAKLQEYNLSVENQQGMMCLHCGQEMQDDCHCHEFDCFMCEPHNFCTKCYGITVYPSV